MNLNNRILRSLFVKLFFAVVTLLLSGLLLACSEQPWAGSATKAIMPQVYQRLAALDGYTFSSTVVQTTNPLPVMANIGLSSQTDSLLINGTVDKPANRTELFLYEQDGYLLDGTGQLELKIEEGIVWGRVREQAWEQLDESARPDTDLSDPVAFLQATRNVQLVGEEERQGQRYQLYTFELDGPAWAAMMRRELQQELVQRGELLANQTLDSLDYYAAMTGQGELWVNAQELPQRIKLHLVYPPLPHETEYREIEITSDYSAWQGLETTTAFASSARWTRFAGTISAALPQTAAETANAALFFALLLSFIALPLLLVRYRSRRGVYRAVALLFVTLLLTEPLLQSHAVQAATERREGRASGLLAQQRTDDRVQEAVDAIKTEFAGRFDLSTSLADQRLLETETLANRGLTDEIYTVAATAADEIDTDGDKLSDALEAELKSDPNGRDSDGDGIDDGTEYLTLGLNPIDPDTDGDLLSDGFEIAAKALGGKNWYLDPTNRDTNNDNIPDSLECIQAIDVVVDPSGKGTKTDPKGTGICDDTDGDGTPDFADDDNDNDGVWDWLDGQPEARFGDPTTGVKDKTFTYKLSDYSADKPLRVTFEIRPTEAQHLWYSRNVLDWPSEDYTGQIRRVHDTKLGTTGAEANGDMQLVPMLEVIMPATEASHLPTIAGKEPIVGDNSRLAEWLQMDVLQRYQMAVSWSQDQQSLQIHAPLTLIRDTKGNAPLNFVAKLLYWPNGAGLFQAEHRARLVWMVQMDTDSCVVPTDSSYNDSCLPEGKNYQNGQHWQTNKKQLVHRYYDRFYLTAFTAESDLGSNTQIFYERPDQIVNPAAYVPDQLLGFGTVLETYLRQQKSPAEALVAYGALKQKDGQPANLGTRLAASAVVQDPDVYGLMAKVATQAAPQLLESVFGPYKDQLRYPTMLYVTWGDSNVKGLGGIQTGDALQLSMKDASHKYGTSIRVGSFTYNPNPGTIGELQNPNWRGVAPGEVWTQSLAAGSLEVYKTLPQNAQQQVDTAQFQQAALSLYWNLSRGVEIANNAAEALGESISGATGFVDEIGAATDNIGENAIGALISVFDDFAEAEGSIGQAATVKGLFGKLSGKDVKNLSNVKGALRSAKVAKGIGTAAVTFAGLSAVNSLVLAFKDQLGLGEGTVAALEAVNATIGAVLAGLQLAQEITKVVQAVQAFSGTAMQGLKTALTFSSEVSKVGAVAAVIVVAVILVATLIYFFKLLGDDAIAAKSALAQGVATAVIVVLLFVIGLFFPIGTAIALIVGLLDAIFTAICKIANWAGGKDSDGKTFEDRNSGFCNGIVGNVTAAIASFFYNTKPLVDMSYAGRLQLGRTDAKLVEQAGIVGVSAGNELKVTQSVTMTARIPKELDYPYIDPRKLTTGEIAEADKDYTQVGIGGNPMTLAEYDKVIKEKNVFNYELVTSEEQATDEAKKNIVTPQAWKGIGIVADRNRLYKVEHPTLAIRLEAGINWHPDLYLREYYRYSLAECGLFAGGCDDEFEEFDKLKTDKTNIDLGKNLIYDVFPATLTEFYTLEQVQENGGYVNRYRLAWGGQDKPFPTLVDADGDGLRSDGTATLDPDDKSGDKDGDGLPDPFEVQDFRLDPARADTDGDGLNDYQEIRYGTRPDRADSDSDGLTDGDELTGWELVYIDANNSTQRTWVTSNPLAFDTDGDGLSDQQERVLGFHPRARTATPTILSMRTTTNQTGSTYLGPNTQINFSTTVKNELRKPEAIGLLEAELLNANSAINPLTFNLQPQQEQTLSGSINVPATAPNGTADEITLRNRAGANIVDPTATYANQLKGLAQPDGLKFNVTFEQRPADPKRFADTTGNGTLTCVDGFCPPINYSSDSYSAFASNSWYMVTGEKLGFTQPRFSIGGWVTPKVAFGGAYNERVLFGPQNVNGPVDQYLQLSLVDVLGGRTPKAKIRFTATDGAFCEQILTELTAPHDQKTHIFVTYDGTQVIGYKNGVRIGSYTLQNCVNKVPAGNSFTIGRGASEAKIFFHEIYFREVDEGSWPRSAETYIYWPNNNNEKLWNQDGIRDDNTRGISKEFTLRTAADGDSTRRVIVCEDDGDFPCGDGGKDDDYHGEITVDPRVNEFRTGAWSSGEGSGDLRHNIQNNFFQGDLYDLRIYENTLTDREVTQLVNGGGLLYQLDEGAGSSTFRNAGPDATQLSCINTNACGTSGVKGYSGQALLVNGGQGLQITKLRERFGSNFAVSFWLKPAATGGTSGALIRSGQGSEGYRLIATPTGNGLALNSRFNSSETGFGTIGGSGGGGYDHRCEANEAMVGLYGRRGGLVDSVGLVCVDIDANGRWVGEPARRGLSGGNGGGDYSVTCERDRAVTGFQGRSGSLVDQIELFCAPLLTDGYVDSGNRSALPKIGGDGGNGQALRLCPSNLPANGIYGQAGGAVDAFGLRCRDSFTGHNRTVMANDGWTHIGFVQQETRLTLYINGVEQQAITFGEHHRDQFRLRGNYSPDLVIGQGLAGLIDEVQIQGLEPDPRAQVTRLYNESAAVYLPLDETTGNSTFVNSTGKGNLICSDNNSCPTAGVKGRVREGLLFAGQAGAPSLTVNDHRHDAFSFSTWVNLPGALNGSAALVSLHDNATAESFAWRLQLTNRDGKIVPEFVGRTTPDGNSCSGEMRVTPANVNLALNQWHHLGVSYDPQNGKNEISLYLNGQLIHQQRLSGLLCRAGTALRFGQNYKGYLDEFTFYYRPLVVSEFLSQYVYQNTWYDVVTTEKFQVDYDKPTVKVTANPYVKAGTNIFGVAVSDTKSGIKLVEYKDSDGTWKAATAETVTAGVWAFGRNIQGTTTLEVRATDNVGNVNSDTRTVTVDGTPPSVALNTTGKQTKLALQGTASDSGSGLQSATIMIIDPLGAPMSAPRDLTVTNGSWQYSQELPPVVNGTFTIWASAVDQMGNEFKGNVGTVQIDNAPPTVGLIADSYTYSGIGAASPVIKGYVADQPYPEGMALFIGFEDQGTGGVVNRTLDLSGNQWQAIPASGSSGPAIVYATPHHQADFALGQTLVITHANPNNTTGNLRLDPNSHTIMAWINPASVAPAEGQILHQIGQTGYGLLLKGDQLTLRINRNGSPIDKDTGHRLVAGQFQHVTVSFDLNKVGEQVVTTWVGSAPGKSLTLDATARIAFSAAPLQIGATVNGFAGRIDDIIVYQRPFNELEARQLAQSAPSTIKSVEVGFLHRQDKDDPTKIIWRTATLDQPDHDGTTWQLPVPGDLEGIYDISLRAVDALDNGRTLPGVWTGIIDTRAPQIALSGATSGQQQCVVTDFSLNTETFTCAAATNVSGATTVNYDAGTGAGLTWNATWFADLYQGQKIPQRLYLLQRDLLDFSVNNMAQSCDRYGNCTQCTVNNGNVATASCNSYSATAALLRSNGLNIASAVQAAAAQSGEANLETEILGPGAFTTTVYYEVPDVYAQGEEPGAPTSSWGVIDEPYLVIDNAVLAPTRPFAEQFTEAYTEIDWSAAPSATHYYAGWTLTETVVISDLMWYAEPEQHLQYLPDQGRYYAHVVAVDDAGLQNSYTLGPIYFDGAPPASYLNWDEYGPNQPYWGWELAETPNGDLCNIIGFDNRVSLLTNETDPRSGWQDLYGTWSDEWLALHWTNLPLDGLGDLHLYLDSKAGGGIYAYNPYHSIDQAEALITMPERRQYESDTTDRLLADYAVIVEDGQTIRLLRWNGATWQNDDAAQLKFVYEDGVLMLWLPLALLGLDPNTMDLSLVSFVTEENAMQVWSTMPGNNPINSPTLVPEHLPDHEKVLVNLRNSMRLSSDSAVNNSADNCPTSVLFDDSILDLKLFAEPGGLRYDPVTYFGVAEAIPDDVEPVLTGLCNGVDPTNSLVCQLAERMLTDQGTDFSDLASAASVGPGETVTYYASVRNVTSQLTGYLSYDLLHEELSLDTFDYVETGNETIDVGELEPLETRVISFTRTMGSNALFNLVTITPVEEVYNAEEAITITYYHPDEGLDHEIDSFPPDGGEIATPDEQTVIGVGEQPFQGLVYDQSQVTEVTLRTSLGGSTTCTDTQQIDAFSSQWRCAITIPAETPDGTAVVVTLSAIDRLGFRGEAIAEATFTVDNAAPALIVFGADGVTAAGVGSTQATTETLTLSGLVGDNRFVEAVTVCDERQGYPSCQNAEIDFFADAQDYRARWADRGLASAPTNGSGWSLETVVEKGIENVTVPYTVTAYDAYGNSTEQSFVTVIDTKEPVITLDAAPATAIGFADAFTFGGQVTDLGTVAVVELAVLTPEGAYLLYPVTLETPNSASTRWRYTIPLDTDEFATPGHYEYTIVARDAFGNEAQLGPYTLAVGSPPPPMINTPYFVTTTNDLWAGFTPGGEIYMRGFIDDADLSLGDQITVTAEPLPTWLMLKRLDERTFEIVGTVPLTITQPLTASESLTEPVDTTLQLYVNVTLVDSTRRQNFQSWQHEVTLDARIPLQANGAVRYADGVATISWQTTNETQMAGFYVLRLTADSTWQRLNPDLIVATQSGAATGASYSFTDSTTAIGQSYTYALELIGTDGRSEQITLGMVNATLQLYLPIVLR